MFSCTMRISCELVNTSSKDRLPARTGGARGGLSSSPPCPASRPVAPCPASRPVATGQRDRILSRLAASEGAIWNGDGRRSACPEKCGPALAVSAAPAPALAAWRIMASDDMPRRCDCARGDPSRNPSGDDSRIPASDHGDCPPRSPTLSEGKRDLRIGDAGPASMLTDWRSVCRQVERWERWIFPAASGATYFRSALAFGPTEQLIGPRAGRRGVDDDGDGWTEKCGWGVGRARAQSSIESGQKDSLKICYIMFMFS